SLMAPLTQTPSANGYSPMALERYIQVRLLFANGYRWGAWYEIENIRSQIPAMLNVRCVITRRPSDAETMREAKLIFVSGDAGHYLYARANVLPRFFVVHRVVSPDSLLAAIKLARDPGFDFSTAAIVEDEAPADVGAGAPGETRVSL